LAAGNHQPAALGLHSRGTRGRTGHAAARTVALAAPLAFAIVLAGLGAVQAAQVLTGGPAHRLALSPANQDAFGLARPIHSLYAVGQSVPTSFGVVAVESAAKIAGLTAKDLAGVTHGIQNLIRPDQVQVQLAVELTNLRNHPVAYTPDQFRLVSTTSSTPLPVFSTNLHPNTLQPEASIDGTLNFVVPRNGAKLVLEFRDQGRARPIRIDLGRIDRTPANAFAGYHHH
jgi:hypothetical protein